MSKLTSAVQNYCDLPQRNISVALVPHTMDRLLQVTNSSITIVIIEAERKKHHQYSKHKIEFDHREIVISYICRGIYVFFQ